MRVVPFIPAHLEDLILHGYQEFMHKYMNEQYGEMLSFYPSYSYVIDDIVKACAGVVPACEDRYVAWALMSKDSGKNMVGITKAVKHFLDTFGGTRVEMHVREDFEQGKRWAEMLGFFCETPVPMRKFAPDGKDYYLYARVR